MRWSQLRDRYAAYAREKGLSQTAIAQASGLPQNTISKLLTNQRRGPNVDTFVRAVQGLGLTLRAFVDPLAGPGVVYYTDEDLQVARMFHDASTDVRMQIMAILMRASRERLRGYMDSHADRDHATVIHTSKPRRRTDGSHSK